MHRIHEEGEVEREEYVDAGTRIVACVDEALAAVIARAAVGGTVGDAAVMGSESGPVEASGASSTRSSRPDGRVRARGACIDGR